MINAADFLEQARYRKINFFTGVPCSLLSPLINRVISDDDSDYVGATSEGEAMAIAAGAWLGGRETMVMCQNSGLGNTINPITSLNWPFRIPTLIVVTWRGQPGNMDEPQHELMGRITAELLAEVNVRHQLFPRQKDDIAPALDQARTVMDETGLPFALIMEKGSVTGETLKQTTPDRPSPGKFEDLSRGGVLPKRIEVLERILAVVPDAAAIIATTGKCGRELFSLSDRQQHLYQVGSMGGASAMGLGLALSTPRPVVVLDGDGAALMKMGNMATIGARAPGNLVHMILDNGVHDSTGGQATVSSGVDFARIALACGYQSGVLADDLEGLEVAFVRALENPGPHMIHVKMKPGSISALGRPTIGPAEVARRFKGFILGQTP